MNGSISRGFSGLAVVCILAACGARTGASTSSESSESEANTEEGEAESESESESGGDLCPDAALVYGSVCFTPYPEPGGGRFPAQLDDEPGDELITFDNDLLAVHKWTGDGFAKVGEAPTPAISPTKGKYVAVGEFDAEPGRDVIAVNGGQWATLYHVSDGELEQQWTTTFDGPFPSPDSLSFAIPIGPDGDGRWRLIGRLDDSKDPGPGLRLLSIWEVDGTQLVEERLEVDNGACALNWCSGGDFNGDGRADAVCLLDDVCNDVPDEDRQTHVLVLAQEDGSVAVSLHPLGVEVSAPFAVGDINGDGRDDLVDGARYRLGMANGLGPVEPGVELPDPPNLRWRRVSVGDVTGDGVDDVLLGEGQDGLLLQHLGGQVLLDSIALGAGGSFPVGPSPAADFNGDEISDPWIADGDVLISEVQP